MPMALFVVGALNGLKSLSRAEVKSIAGSVYLKCKSMHDGTKETWPRYLFLSMKNAFLRESLKNTKGGIRQAPMGIIVQSLSTAVNPEGVTDQEDVEKLASRNRESNDILDRLSYNPKVEEKILSQEIQAKISSILGTKLASIYLGKVMYDMSYRDMAERVGMSHEWVRQKFNEAEGKVERAKKQGVFKR